MAAHTMNKSILSFLGQINGCIYGTHALNPLNRDGLSPFCLFPVSMVCVRRVTPGQRMPVDQDWTAVYPTAAPFRQGSVPLPVRMGFPVKRGVPPEKGNLELIKIPYFLHLTPAAIKKHCEPLKHKSTFCTEWPSALDTDAKYDEHFPVKVKSKDYVSAGTSLRNPSARIVHLRVKQYFFVNKCFYFGIYNNLDKNVQNEQLHFYADTVIYCCASSLPKACQNLQTAFNTVQHSLCQLKLILNTDN
uniref:Mitochondrial ribosomal protein S35 n=1 Tax=Salmo trutta TaxID=8032 RepID=A0A673XCL7_SALTR